MKTVFGGLQIGMYGPGDYVRFHGIPIVWEHTPIELNWGKKPLLELRGERKVAVMFDEAQVYDEGER